MWGYKLVLKISKLICIALHVKQDKHKYVDIIVNVP